MSVSLNACPKHLQKLSDKTTSCTYSILLPTFARAAVGGISHEYLLYVNRAIFEQLPVVQVEDNNSHLTVAQNSQFHGFLEETIFPLQKCYLQRQIKKSAVSAEEEVTSVRRLLKSPSTVAVSILLTCLFRSSSIRWILIFLRPTFFGSIAPVALWTSAASIVPISAPLYEHTPGERRVFLARVATETDTSQSSAARKVETLQCK